MIFSLAVRYDCLAVAEMYDCGFGLIWDNRTWGGSASVVGFHSFLHSLFLGGGYHFLAMVCALKINWVYIGKYAANLMKTNVVFLSFVQTGTYLIPMMMGLFGCAILRFCSSEEWKVGREMI